jgi:hypothetical protein
MRGTFDTRLMLMANSACVGRVESPHFKEQGSVRKKSCRGGNFIAAAALKVVCSGYAVGG